MLPAWAGLREFRVVEREFEDAARSVCSFYLKPVESLPLPPFKAGQFITISLHVPVPGQNPKIVTRCYSLSSKPGDERFRISVKRATAPANLPDVPAGLASNHLHDHADVGAVVGLKAPSGQFHIDPDAGIPLVLVAGGIGVTPLLSMLLWCLDKQPRGRSISIAGPGTDRSRRSSRCWKHWRHVTPTCTWHSSAAVRRATKPSAWTTTIAATWTPTCCAGRCRSAGMPSTSAVRPR